MATNGIVLDALGDPTRRSIFETLRDGPRSVGELADGLPVSRPAVSQHLRVLEAGGPRQPPQDGTRNLYRIEPGGVAELRDYFDRFWGDALERFAEETRKETG